MPAPANNRVESLIPRPAAFKPTAGAMEAVVWAYAYRRPTDRIEQGAAGAFAELTNEELRRRLRAALTTMPKD